MKQKNITNKFELAFSYGKRYYYALAAALIIIGCNNNEQKTAVPKVEDSISSQADLNKFQEQFYLGAHLCREPMPPMDELKKDMQILKKQGFNLIKLQEQWAYNEPEEGQYDFSKYDSLISYAKELGMYVYLGLTMEEAPAWLYRKYPDCRMVGHNGMPVVYEAQSPMPADGKPGPCFDHPGARDAQKKFIEQIVKVLGRHDNLLVWNTWQEVGYWPDRMIGQPVCYCENTMKAFHSWLKEKYKTLEELNKEWKTNYANWEYISPSRNYRQRIGIPQNIYWDYFMDNVKISHTLKERAAIIRRNDSLHRPVFCHLGEWSYGSGKDWTWARSQDFLGSSSYPASNWGEFNDWDDAEINNGTKQDTYTAGLDEIWRMLALRFDYLRSCNVKDHPVWAAEFQGGPVSTGFHKGRVPTPTDMRKWMFTAIGSGVNTISFWVTRAEIMPAEANGFSLLDSEGDSTARLTEASKIGRAFIKHADIFAKPSWGGAEVAILVNENNYRFTENTPRAVEHLEYSTRGWHRLLWESGIPVDFIEASDLSTINLNQYKAIVMPFPVSLSDNILGALEKYTNNGGNLISEAAIARFDHNGYANRGEISSLAAKLFGVKQKSYTMISEPDGGRRWSPSARTWGEFLEPAMLKGSGALAGTSTRANAYVQTFNCTDSKPILFYNDQVAGTEKSVGKGKAFLLGSYVGHSGTAYRDQFTPSFVSSLMKQVGIAPLHDGRLIVRKRIIDNKQALIITNPTKQKLVEKINVNGWNNATDLFDQPLNIKDNNITVSLESLDVMIILLTRS